MEIPFIIEDQSTLFVYSQKKRKTCGRISDILRVGLPIFAIEYILWPCHRCKLGMITPSVITVLYRAPTIQ